MKKKVFLLGLLAATGTLLGGCWGTVHNFVIHGSELVQFWGALNQLGIA